MNIVVVGSRQHNNNIKIKSTCTLGFLKLLLIGTEGIIIMRIIPTIANYYITPQRRSILCVVLCANHVVLLSSLFTSVSNVAGVLLPLVAKGNFIVIK
jgi:hypothetical protein